MQKQKKAQLGGLSASIIGLVVAVIILVLGIVILQEIRDIDMVAKANSELFGNETLSDAATRTLACNARGGALCSLTRVTNATGGETVPTTNYTVSNCKLTETIGVPTFGTWNASYSCTYGDVVYTSANASLVGVSDFADFIPIIVIALAAAIVIGLILSGFAFSRKER